ncbi:integral membrane sensor signal transduction histidine kinase [Planococcus donghaensis MPA1U2]|uniref:histidine kinase n=1 Tax=Planococcus donghaensis MPA1U2 TaxID=933115 RepID=E7RDY9_9BACL|nr:ATP-binding protein [Planococcus donghaensis]EGA90803.1 integral membrane sensor signal transduction histidine kinase [Planococcus donghaensis MPA1U2]
MNRQPIFRKQQLRFMILNMIAFSIIFTIFGVIIFQQVQNTLFLKTDDDLTQAKEFVLSEDFTTIRSPLENGPELGPPGGINPRIIVLNWNAAGDIVNEDQIGTWLYESFSQESILKIENLNTITNLSVDDEYTYRSLLIENDTADGEIAYTQLLINIDGEQTILDNFGQLLIICSLIFIVLSISASYILSKKMMEPIIKSWNKQAEFVENASHELRTPLTIIQNKLELLLVEPQQKIIQKFENIALSLSETRRLSKLTSDLLTLARADSAEIQLDKHPLHVDEFIERVSVPYIEIAESQNKTLQLDLNCKTEIQADEVRLHQLLVILLDNALKYTEEEEHIFVKTYTEDLKAVIEIRDTGRGIQKENLPYIFDRFYREDKARSRENGGIGLGLSIAQWIVTHHGGTITASQNGQAGTLFKVKLPQ